MRHTVLSADAGKAVPKPESCGNAPLRNSSTPVRPFIRPLLLLAALAIPSQFSAADTVTVAVAANFRPAMEQLAPMFSSSTVHHARCVYGSTGGLYAQIVNGAPYDVFMAADDEKPLLLVKNGHALAETRYVYAVGRLALWAPFAATGAIPMTVLTSTRQIAIPQPAVAPYGRAARSAMEKLGVWRQLEKDIVHGMDVGQTFHFVSTGAAGAGFVSLSQLLSLPERDRGWHWVVPESHYPALRQELVVLSRAASNPAAYAFAAFLAGNSARTCISGFGYSIDARSGADSRQEGGGL